MNHLFTRLHLLGLRLFSHRQTLPTPISIVQMPQGMPANPPDPYPGRELMFTLIRELLTLQHQTADQHDTKATGILVGGTTMVGFAFLVQHHPVGNCSALIPIWLHQWPVMIRLAIPYVPFLLCYLLSMIFALQASRIRGYWAVPDPVKALKIMKEPEQDLKLLLNRTMAHYSKINESILDKKAGWIRWAARLLVGEIAALVLLLLYQTVC
jgi:hypothetical protein